MTQKFKGVTQWEIWHPDGEKEGLSPAKFGSKKEADVRARELNKECPGHIVRPVLPVRICIGIEELIGKKIDLKQWFIKETLGEAFVNVEGIKATEFKTK